MFILTYIVAPIITTDSNFFYRSEVAAYFINNALTLQTEYFLPGVFSDLRNNAVNGSLWSIYVEVRLYMVLAAFYIFGIMNNKTIFNTIFTVIVIVGFFRPDINLTLFSHEEHVHVAFMFLVGSFFWMNKKDVTLTSWISFLLLITLAVMHKTDKFGIIYNVALPYFVFMVAFIPGLGLFNKLGDYSYGVYLYGWPAQQIILVMKPEMSAIENAIGACVITLSLAIISWHFVESPCIKLKKRILFRARLKNTLLT